jgi:hypothetical protein
VCRTDVGKVKKVAAWRMAESYVIVKEKKDEV